MNLLKYFPPPNSSSLSLFDTRCVYFDTSVREWISPRGVCTVNNNLEDGQDDFVDCSCKHLTHYAVKANAIDPGLVGYPTGFYVASFICMVSTKNMNIFTAVAFSFWLIYNLQLTNSFVFENIYCYIPIKHWVCDKHIRMSLWGTL